MDDPLQRLLEVEARARALVDDASRHRQRIVEEALAAARQAEAQFEAERVAVREPYLRDAQERAEQAIGELARKYTERQRTLRELASRHEAEAVDAALTLLLDPAA